MHKIFPVDILRGYHLHTVAHESADDEEFYLCFEKSGDVGVYVFYSPNKPYSKGYWSERIDASQFGTFDVDGAPLRQLVVDKLQSILPPGF